MEHMWKETDRRKQK